MGLPLPGPADQPSGHDDACVPTYPSRMVKLYKEQSVSTHQHFANFAPNTIHHKARRSNEYAKTHTIDYTVLAGYTNSLHPLPYVKGTL